MKKRRVMWYKRLVFFSTIFVFLPSIVFAQSYYFERKITSEYSVGIGQQKISKVSTEQVYTSGQMMKVFEKESGRMHIIRFDRKVIYTLDTIRKVYAEKSFRILGPAPDSAVMKSTMSDPQRNLGMQTARESMLKSSSDINSAQLSLMQQMMMQQQTKMLVQRKVEDTMAKNDVMVVKWAPDIKKVEGFLCKRFKIVKGDKLLYKGWITDQTGPQDYYLHFIAANESLNGDVIRELKKITGFPIREKYKVQTGQRTGAMQKSQVTLIENRSVTPFEFEIPTGYAREGVAVVPTQVEEYDDDDW